MPKLIRTACLVLALLCLSQLSHPEAPHNKNNPAAVELYRDRSLGLFIHWGVDGPLAGIISHSLVGASPEFQQRFFTELPQYFNPKHFDPDEYASLAKLAGFKYVVFTTKHHAGFCMWDTKTTDFSVMHTPYGRDVLRQTIDAFRKQGIAIGLYFSPDDFWWLYQHHIPINRHVKGVYPQEIPAFMEYTKAQMHELLTNYGPIDSMFFDGPAEELIDYAWQLQPNLVITRGVMETPEQYTPGIALKGAWESNMTIGNEWPWKATNEEYKSGTRLIEILTETRAKGGNFVLNIGPKPDGSIAIEQESRLRELALWNFVNQDAIFATRPWVITNEGNIWFTRSKDGSTVYAILTHMEPWRLGEARNLVLHSVRATPQTTAGVLGQSDTIVEYKPEVTPKTEWQQQADGLHIKVTRAQRLYTDGKWPNPIVVEVTHVQPALAPPAVETLSVSYDAQQKTATFNGRLTSLGDAPTLQTGFQYRPIRSGTDTSERTEPWIDLPLQPQTSAGNFTATLTTLPPNARYEFRARVHHPLLDLYGAEKPFATTSH